MRVISGIYKRRRFDVPRTFKARPTTDFAKENLFNVLNNYIDFEEGITALDLFAGTGSISIELVSRGCDRVISIEKDPAHHSFICKIMKEVQTDKCLPIRGDVFKFIKNGRDVCPNSSKRSVYFRAGPEEIFLSFQGQFLRHT